MAPVDSGVPPAAIVDPVEDIGPVASVDVGEDPATGVEESNGAGVAGAAPPPKYNQAAPPSTPKIRSVVRSIRFHSHNFLISGGPTIASTATAATQYQFCVNQAASVPAVLPGSR